MILRETEMISRETKRFRAKVQTSLQTANNDWFLDLQIVLDQPASKQAASKHIEQQAGSFNHVWKQWARAKAILRTINQMT